MKISLLPLVAVATAPWVPLALGALPGWSQDSSGDAPRDVPREATGTAAQEGTPEAAPEEPAARVLVKVPPRAEQAAAHFDADRWRAALTAEDLDAREASFEQMVQKARRNPAARAWLEETAEGTAGADGLAWTARLALRELGSWGAGISGQRGPAIHSLDEVERHLEELRERFAPGWNPRLDPLVIPFPTINQSRAVPGAGFSSSTRGVDVRSGADGWTIRVVENEDGEETVREYTGATLEEILAANPELRDQVGIVGSLSGEGISLRIGSELGQPFDFDSLLEGFALRDPFEDWDARGRGTWVPEEPPGRGSAPIRTDVFGVVARLNPDGPGLLVRDAAAGTIAQLLGIGTGDVLLQLNGVELEDGDAITRVMGARAEDEGVTAVWLDTTGVRRTATWRPQG